MRISARWAGAAVRRDRARTQPGDALQRPHHVVLPALLHAVPSVWMVSTLAEPVAAPSVSTSPHSTSMAPTTPTRRRTAIAARSRARSPRIRRADPQSVPHRAEVGALAGLGGLRGELGHGFLLITGQGRWMDVTATDRSRLPHTWHPAPRQEAGIGRVDAGRNRAARREETHMHGLRC